LDIIELLLVVLMLIFDVPEKSEMSDEALRVEDDVPADVAKDNVELLLLLLE
jgi:hypothetical protein